MSESLKKEKLRKWDIFQHPTAGRKTKVKFYPTEAEHIGGGAYGEIYKLPVELHSSLQQERYKVKTFILKQFHDPECAQQAFEKYTILKERGLTVFVTYRLSRDSQSILMTNGNREEVIVMKGNKETKERHWIVSTNISKDHLYWKKEKIQNIDLQEFREFLAGLCKECEKAAQCGCALFEDAFFFCIKREKTTQIISLDFVLGDLDLVDLDIEPTDQLILYNIDNALRAANWFIQDYIQPGPLQEICFRIWRTVKDKYKQPNSRLKNYFRHL